MILDDVRKCLSDIKDTDIIKLKSLISTSNNIILLGNGGSNSICSHIAQDLTKVMGKRAITFSDPSRLTCYINDYGMDEAYKKFLEHFADKETLVILISSSGESQNILKCAKYCTKNKNKLILLSGFSYDNSLNNLNSDLSFWVNSYDYGVVECVHQIILHLVI